MTRLTPREVATVIAALEIWKEELGDEWIEECCWFEKHTPLTKEEIDNLQEKLNWEEQVFFVMTTYDNVM